jgi:predicted NBD/HSP70 family sugar kinase
MFLLSTNTFFICFRFDIISDKRYDAVMADTTKLNSINTSRILKAVWKEPGISRIVAAEKNHLDRSTVTKITQNLLDRRIIKESAPMERREELGRKPVGLAINTTLGAVAGIELETDACRGVALDLNGRILSSRTSPLAARPDNLMTPILDIIEHLKRDLVGIKVPLLGVGIGLSGLVDPYRGVLLRSNPLMIQDPLPLKQLLEEILKIPVFLENDANCCCFSDLAFLKEKRDRNFLAVLGEFRRTDIERHLEPGVAFGLGVVIRERVLHGDDFTAGEFRSLYWREGNVTQFSMSNNEIGHLREDRKLRETLFNELFRNLSLIINCLNITRVVFAGDIAEYHDELAPIVTAQVRGNWLYNSEVNCRSDVSPFGIEAVAHGAASLFLEKLFSVPDLVDRPEEVVGIELFDRILH